MKQNPFEGSVPPSTRPAPKLYNPTDKVCPHFGTCQIPAVDRLTQEVAEKAAREIKSLKRKYWLGWGAITLIYFIAYMMK